MEELYSKYADILEHQLPDKDTNNKLSNNLTEHSLYTTVLEFIKMEQEYQTLILVLQQNQIKIQILNF